MAPCNKGTGVALYVDEDGVHKVIRDRTNSEPARGEIQVEVMYSGVNPVDIKHAAGVGMCPTVMGYDFVGRVSKVLPESEFAVGDLVAGYTLLGFEHTKSDKYGTHQPYVVAPEDVIWRVPDHMPHAHAAALTTSVATAADALNHFGYVEPGTRHPNPGFPYGPLLIWGASTSIGLAMLQLARACHASPIFVIASRRHYEMLRKYGAARCFDYADSDVVAKIQAALKEEDAGSFAHVSDCIGTPEAAEKILAVADCRNRVTIAQSREGFMTVYGCRARMTSVRSPVSLVRFTMAPQVYMQRAIWKKVTWAFENYGSKFEFPDVQVFEGKAEEALEKVREVGANERFGKLTLKHPLI
ncbi:putative Alcohol dehydrogenase [Seiridium cardinale]|uniref:Alcohol dehydrogenase n=1 Tax=Seiridium cardinale TaxID=138064 RepID=A0ABR2X8V0_9PEZI